MIPIGVIGAFGLLMLFGGGLAALLLAPRKSINLWEWLCLSWLLGVCAVSLSLWIGGNFLSGVRLEALVTALAFLSASFGRKALMRHHVAPRIPRPRGLLEWLLVGILLIQLATICWVSFKHTLGWDGLLVWEIKARYAFLNGGVLPQTYFHDAGRAFSHQDYPLAIPFTELWLYLWLGEPNQFWAKLIFPIFYGTGAVLLALLGTRLAGERWIGLLTAVLLFFVPQATLSTGSAIVGYADFPLSVYYLATLGYLCLWLAQKSSVSVFAAILLCLPWIKNEGTILWAVTATSAGFFVFVLRRPRRELVWLGPGVFLILGWRVFLRSVAVARGVDFLPINPRNLFANLHRVPSIYHVIAAEITTWQNWGIYWIIFALAALVLACSWRTLSNRILLAGTLLPFALYSAVYIFSAWELYLNHVAASIPRLLAQFVPATLLGVGAAVAQFVVRIKKAPAGEAADAASPGREPGPALV